MMVAPIILHPTGLWWMHSFGDPPPLQPPYILVSLFSGVGGFSSTYIINHPAQAIKAPTFDHVPHFQKDPSVLLGRDDLIKYWTLGLRR
jgi:hypothetical protein